MLIKEALEALHELDSVYREPLMLFYLEDLAYKEIADRMNISIDTVRSYVRTVYEKLHVHSRTEAVVKFLRSEGTR